MLKIGAGLDRLEWNTVWDIVQDLFIDSGILINEYVTNRDTVSNISMRTLSTMRTNATKVNVICNRCKLETQLDTGAGTTMINETQAAASPLSDWRTWTSK